jgi:ADP-heptose:LPS heptosyltransferase
MKLMFVPVSAPRGMGEYARSREIATAVRQRWPEAQIHFVLSREASYARECPFPATLLPSSPTFHSREVGALIESYRPDVVVFDNAGRTAQLRSVVRAKGRVIYISSRTRQRRKAFRLSWMRLIDEHWIAYPEFLAGSLSTFERTKRRLIGRPKIRYVDTVFPEANAIDPATLLARYELQSGGYVAIVPGGGTAHKGAEDAPQIFALAAAKLADLGHRVVLVGLAASIPSAAGVTRTERLPTSELIEIMRQARVVVTNGGDTLLQALACKCTCVASPIAHDQAERIARCAKEGLVLAAPLKADEMAQAVVRLLAGSVQVGPDSAREGGHTIRNMLDDVANAIGSLALLNS